MSESQSIATPKRVSRRELLGYAWLISLIAAAGAGLRASLRFARPQPRAGEFGGVINMGPMSELPPPGSPPIHQPAGRFWLVPRDNGLLALHKACTHLDCLCNWDEQNREFVCPCHGSRFAEDGAELVGPATRALDRFVVQVVTPTGETIAETDPVRGAPVSLPGVMASASTTGDASVEAVEGDEVADEDPGYIVLVDTGRKILGAASEKK